MTAAAKRSLIATCCCFVGFMVADGVAMGFSFASLDTHDMADNYIAVGVYLVSLWLALSTVLLVVHNWEEWWKR